ncbi:hypothetical protein FNV43_RR16941 [Rhamnella rubrinervis]|uniref:Uncharacterized protein n=1 Tax=Rhamnella rubrinervis TaxID=2594499 RepID=A0A8K0GZR5_9ROSA|nr:hypothetical protein FNV43_RR16941 [Rhamnella rubrinervis]
MARIIENSISFEPFGFGLAVSLSTVMVMAAWEPGYPASRVRSQRSSRRIGLGRVDLSFPDLLRRDLSSWTLGQVLGFEFAVNRGIESVSLIAIHGFELGFGGFELACGFLVREPDRPRLSLQQLVAENARGMSAPQTNGGAPPSFAAVVRGNDSTTGSSYAASVLSVGNIGIPRFFSILQRTSGGLSDDSKRVPPMAKPSSGKDDSKAPTQIRSQASSSAGYKSWPILVQTLKILIDLHFYEVKCMLDDFLSGMGVVFPRSKNLRRFGTSCRFYDHPVIIGDFNAILKRMSFLHPGRLGPGYVQSKLDSLSRLDSCLEVWDSACCTLAKRIPIITHRIKSSKIVKHALRWNGCLGNIHNKITLAKEKLLSVQNIIGTEGFTEERLAEEAAAQVSLDEALLFKETMLRDQCRVKWLRIGDRELQGINISDEATIRSHIVDYYRSLFSADESLKMDFRIRWDHSEAPMDENSNLTGRLFEEVRHALFNPTRPKAPTMAFRVLSFRFFGTLFIPMWWMR